MPDTDAFRALTIVPALTYSGPIAAGGVAKRRAVA